MIPAKNFVHSNLKYETESHTDLLSSAITAMARRYDYRYPDDYIEYCYAYPPGRIYHPKRYSRFIYHVLDTQYTESIDTEIAAVQDNCEYGDFQYGAQLYPSIPGIFPLGSDENGASYWFHLKSRDSNDYTVGIIGSRSESFEDTGLQLYEFLEGLIKNAIPQLTIDDNDEGAMPVYIAYPKGRWSVCK